MKHRVFVAVGLPLSLQEEILKWEGKLESLPVRWLEGKDMHITLAPPWQEVDWTHAIEKLKAVHSDPFSVRFIRVTFGPDPREPRLIWAEGEQSQQLTTLRENVHTTLHVKPEWRPFVPHLTLARFKAETFRDFPIRTLNERVHWQFEVSSILLMESRLSETGAEYEILQEILLGSEH